MPRRLKDTEIHAIFREFLKKGESVRHMVRKGEVYRLDDRASTPPSWPAASIIAGQVAVVSSKLYLEALCGGVPVEILALTLVLNGASESRLKAPHVYSLFAAST